MTAALHGNLRDFGIGEVFQLIGQQCKSGALDVDTDDERLRVLFAEGKVVSAETVGPHDDASLGDMLVRCGLLTADQLVAVERDRGEGSADFRRLLIQHTDLSADEIEEIAELATQETLFTLLRAGTGSFHFHPRTVKLPRNPARALPAEQILMDGLRMVDEWRALDPQATDENTVFQRTGRFETYREFAGSETPARLAAVERMLLAVDGRTPARQLIDRSRLGSFEGARVLADLKGAGVIGALDAASLVRSRRRDVARGGALGTLGLASAALPFVLLALVVGLLLRPGSQPAAEHRFGIERDPVAEAQQAFATRRLRNLVEAHRWASGDWPEDLGELVARGWIDSAALAAEGAGTYHYTRRGDGALVLAPPH